MTDYVSHLHVQQPAQRRCSPRVTGVADMTSVPLRTARRLRSHGRAPLRWFVPRERGNGRDRVARGSLA